MRFFYDYFKSIGSGLIGVYFITKSILGFLTGKITLHGRGGGETTYEAPISYYLSLGMLAVGILLVYFFYSSVREFLFIKRTKRSSHFNKVELINLLKIKNISEEIYSLHGGLPEKRFCLHETNGNWEVYYSDNGEKQSLKNFESESEACEYFFDWIDKSVYNVK